MSIHYDDLSLLDDVDLSSIDYEIGALEDELAQALGADTTRSLRLSPQAARAALAATQPAESRRILDVVKLVQNNLKALVERQKATEAQIKAAEAALSRERIVGASAVGGVPQIFLGVDSRHNGGAPIAGGASRTIAVESTDPLRIMNFLVDDSVFEFAITRIQVGRLNLLAGSHAIPASIFKSAVERPPMQTPVLQAGTEAKVEVVNLSQVPRHFLGAFTGIDLAQTKRA